MILKPALSALLTTGLISPVKAEVYVPHKPAIIKPKNLEFSQHMLAMPLTMGMLAATGRQVIHVGTATSTNNNVTIPAHQVGDLIIIWFSSIDGTTTPSGVGLTNLTVAGPDNNGIRVRIAYKFATSTSETSGNWTGTDPDTAASVYRNVASIGAFSNWASTGNTTTLTWPAVTFTNNTNGRSWAVGMASVYLTVSGTPNAPTGQTQRANNDYFRIWDSNGGIAGNYSSQTSTMSSQSGVSTVIQLRP